MKTVLLSIAFAIVSSLGFTQEKTGHTITVTIENVKNDFGKILLGLHDKTTFMKADAVAKGISAIKNGTCSITLENIQPGEYAILALHDENENERMDFEDNGMPAESYGTSNNPRSFGPPIYDDAKFKLGEEDLKISIRL